MTESNLRSLVDVSPFAFDLELNLSVDPIDSILFEEDANYYSDTHYLSNSNIGRMEDDPHVFYQYLKGNYKYDTKVVAFVVGRHTHVLALEPEKASDFHVVESKTGRRTKMFADAVENYGYDWCVTREEFERDTAMAKAFKEAEGVADMLSISELEKPFVGYDPFGYGIPVKGKLDIYTPQDADYGIAVGDLKTTAKRMQDFPFSVAKYDYDRQAAMYMSLTGANAMKFYPVSKTDGHAVGEFIIERDSKTFQQGMWKYEQSIEKFHRLYVQGNYRPTYLYSKKLR